MSVWNEKAGDSTESDKPALIDAVFKLNCRSLPVDHCVALSSAILKITPWLADYPGSGIHPIHVAGSQNGWERPASESREPLLLSKRTRLRVRVSSDQAQRLINQLRNVQLDIAGHSLIIEDGNQKSFGPSDTLFSRYTVFQDTRQHLDEDSFIEKVIENCVQTGFQPSKVLSGMTQTLAGPNGPLHTRSVMLADVPLPQSLLLQEKGIGDLRLMGCGIVLHHKSTGAVG